MAQDKYVYLGLKAEGEDSARVVFSDENGDPATVGEGENKRVLELVVGGDPVELTDEQAKQLRAEGHNVRKATDSQVENAEEKSATTVETDPRQTSPDPNKIPAANKPAGR